MADEGSFLRAILAHPADDLPRLVYADWLDEQQSDDATRKAEFLRLQNTLRGTDAKDRRHQRSRTRVRHLAEHLPTGWLAAVSHLGVEGCAAGRTGVEPLSFRRPLETLQFAYQCPKEWAALTATDDDRVRHCPACQQSVYFCESLNEARHHAWQGECVAVNLAVKRSPGDLEMPMVTMGIIGPSYLDADPDDAEKREE